jgi:hypothetical protein
MATKKTVPKFGAKAEFVRALPRDLPAKEVVEAAKKKGLVIGENYVYTIRSAAATGEKGAKAKPGPKPGSKGAAGASGMTPAEVQLRNAIADLGLVKAGEILASVTATIKGR